jgi:Fe-Mn family superoxide dismutase
MSLMPYLCPEKRYPYELPSLGYSYDALEPHFDHQTMELHHAKHHQAYIDKLNEALERHPDCQKYNLEELLINLEKLPSDVQRAIANHGGGHYNHTLFWQLLSDDNQKPSDDLETVLSKSFGSFDHFKEEFNETARNCFGSGWTWLCLEQSDRLFITTTSNQNCPLSNGHRPVMGLDLWEHAYYLQYQNRRPDYIESFWNVINWRRVEEIYEAAHASR